MILWSKGIDAVGGQPGRSTNRNQKRNEGLSRAQSHYASLAAYSCVKSAPRIATPTRRAPDVRLRERAFEEGQSVAIDVNEARNSLVRAETGRAQIAYEFVVSLGALLEASGQIGRFPEFMKRAEVQL